MKKILLLFIFPFFCFAQSENNPCETLSNINALIQSQHYKPKAVDDSLSVYVFNAFLDELDKDNNLFLEQEVNALKKHQYKIDNYIYDKNCDFLNDFFVAYYKAVNRYNSIVESIKNEPFPFSRNENIRFSKKSFPYLKDEKELKHLYQKSILFSVLKDVAELSKNKDSLKTNFNKIAAESKNRIIDTYSCKTSGLKLTKEEFYAKFYTIFCTYFDPHTEYLSQSDKSSFLANVSADNLTFGIYLSMNEKDEISVEEIIPGSSAYFTEKIDIGDQILKIKNNNNEYTIACSSMKKIEEIISSSNYKSAEFTLRKKSGEIYSVALTKKVMKDYENNVYSYILEKDNTKTGYIRIPSFYALFDNGKTSVSDDVAKEIYKLQDEKLDGIIIDLENDGGGSMDEAIKLTGMFTDIGPIAIMNNHLDKKEVIKDPNRGSFYSGPMVVMINGFSASASEFFTNAMQDYNRAIVIGNQSLGKASMQRILPITNERNPSAFIKLTIEKFYRITGKSNQYIGITPDVEISSLFDKQMPRENSNPTALRNDEIKPVTKFTPFPNPKKEQAIALSKKRIEQNETIKKINDLNTKINDLYDNDLPSIALNFDAVFEQISKVNLLWASIKELSEIKNPITVKRNATDAEYQQYDEYLKSSNDEKIKAIQTNVHIFEAVNIINDLKN